MLTVNHLIEKNKRLTDLLDRARIALQLNKTTVLHPKYKIVYADPPWPYGNKGVRGGIAKHYEGMNVEDIKALPIRYITDPDCILFLWMTYPMIEDGLEVMKAWGFKYKTIGFQWIKLNRKAGTPFFGTGSWTRANTEACFIGLKGRPERLSNKVSQIIQAPIQKEHSKKPDIVRDKIVELMGDLPRIELFATQRTEGWDCWGDQVDSDIDLSIPAPRKVIK
jgi:N6-adenosine-specific RNA methylase IME4